MSTRYDLHAMVDFDAVTGSTGPSGANYATRGVIFKAGCASSAATEAGLGVNRTIDNAGNLTYPATGGVKATAAGDGFHIPIPTAFQSSIVNEGSLQFDVNATDFLAYTGSAAPLIALVGAAQAVAGPTVNASYAASGSYQSWTAGSDGVSAYVSATTFRLSSGFVTTEIFENVLTETVPTTNGWITIGISWTNKSVLTLVNGVPVSRAHRKATSLLAASKATNLYCLGTVGIANGAPGIAIKNILLFNSPRADGMRMPYQRRVVFVGHSFCDTAQGAYQVLPRDSTKSWQTRGSAICSPLSLDSSVWRRLVTKCNLYCAATSSTSASSFLARIQGASFAYPAADGTAYNPVTRWNPHIVVICGMNNEVSAGNVTTNVPLLVAACVALGVVPIFVREQNRNAAGASGASSGDRSAYDAALVAAVTAARLVYGDIGIVDCYTPTGGATCANINAENISAKIHPTLYAQDNYYGPGIAAEIDRLIASPPAYAWWK